MSRMFDSKKKQQYMTIALTSLLIVGIVVGVFYAAKSAGWLAAGSAVDETKMIIVVKQKNNESADLTDEIKLTWYRWDTTDKTDDDIEDLALSDFDAPFDPANEFKVEFDKKYIYLLKINGTGYDTIYACSNVLVAGGNLEILGTGENVFHIFKNPTTAGFKVTPLEGWDQSIQNTTEEKWKVELGTKDAKDKLTDKVGYASLYDFSITDKNKAQKYVIFTIQFNKTDVTSLLATVKGFTTQTRTSNDTLYFFIDCDFCTGISFDVEFDCDLTEWGVRGFGIGFGTMDLTAYQPIDVKT